MRLVASVVLLFSSFLWLVPANAATADQSASQISSQQVEFEKPLYKPFIERYVLDELKALRTELAASKIEFETRLAQRELKAGDRALSYVTDAMTYFFYLIAIVSSLLVIVGWNSMRDIKEKAHNMASEKVTELVSQYEKRLKEIEKDLRLTARDIDENREEIEKTQELHSLWLRASQEPLFVNKIPIYDQILALNPSDGEALTYKADAALEQDEPKWAINLCQQALVIDPENSHAFYQLACAYTALDALEDATNYFRSALSLNESYRGEARTDKALEPLLNHQPFIELLENPIAE
ncbi:TPR end-of-group domain-containing protein [Pelagibaculum spongiae]|uniref:Uncharacterized protein n=1 Tax=Pelagibaculum spongiae TaxID=2080658 RepID=A0A2V1H0I1_9GAMM|nr:hypothetical protein [Pelagibaculum spongiae]PVZ68170.1 hypothetical protein DC094_12775 [Pelagibaculum spongiae]